MIELPDPPERRTMPTLPPITVKSGRRFDEDLAQIIDGKVLLPNAVEIGADEFIKRVFQHATDVRTGWVVIDPDADPIRHSGHLTAMMYHQGDGTGIVMARNDRGGANPIRIYTFAICRHEMVSDSTREQDQRGWHQSHCTKCGYSYSYDSGD